MLQTAGSGPPCAAMTTRLLLMQFSILLLAWP